MLAIGFAKQQLVKAGQPVFIRICMFITLVYSSNTVSTTNRLLSHLPGLHLLPGIHSFLSSLMSSPSGHSHPLTTQTSGHGKKNKNLLSHVR